MEVQVLAVCFWVTAPIVFQAAVNRGHHLLQALDAISDKARKTLTTPFILNKKIYVYHERSYVSFSIFLYILVLFGTAWCPEPIPEATGTRQGMIQDGVPSQHTHTVHKI